MTREELIKLHEDTCNAARKTMIIKNQDYSCESVNESPFSNFTGSEALGIEPVMGIMLRVFDKMKRIQAFSANGTLSVENESVHDAIEDILNYVILAKGIIISREEK